MHIESSPNQQEPEPEATKRPHGGILRHLHLGRKNGVSSNENSFIDPLGGSLGSFSEIRKEAVTEEENRSWIRRRVSAALGWATYDEPNLTTGDIMLIVDPGVEEPLSEREQIDIDATVKLLREVRPVKSSFYKELLSESPADAESTH
jgi:hypothetical protein